MNADMNVDTTSLKTSVCDNDILYILRKWYFMAKHLRRPLSQTKLLPQQGKRPLQNSVNIRLLVASNVSKISRLTGLSYRFTYTNSVCAALLLEALKKKKKTARPNKFTAAARVTCLLQQMSFAQYDSWYTVHPY